MASPENTPPVDDSVVGIAPEFIDLSAPSPWKTRLVGAALVTAAGVALAFEQSPANELVRASAGLNVLDHTHNPAIAGGAIGAITMGVEMGSSSLVAVGLHKRGDALRKFVNRFFKKHDLSETDEPIEDKDVSKLTGADLVTSLGVGSAIVMTKKHLQEGTPDLKRDLKNGAKASGVIAGVSTGVGVLASGGIEYADKVGLEEPAELIVKYGTDWKFWLGAALFAQSYSWVKSRMSQKQATDSGP